MIALASLTDTADKIVTNFGVDWPMFIAQSINFTLVSHWLFGFSPSKRFCLQSKEREKQIADSLKNADRIKLELEETQIKSKRRRSMKHPWRRKRLLSKLKSKLSLS